eukprot:8362353-Karenia_brevis.AAC.1
MQVVGVVHDFSGNLWQWRHDRPGPHLRWEAVLISCFGMHWRDRATTKAWWTTHAEFITSAYAKL